MICKPFWISSGNLKTSGHCFMLPMYTKKHALGTPVVSLDHANAKWKEKGPFWEKPMLFKGF